ncbi:hypothetical protein CPC08DRAFT_438585 [Agrocybe pediades]|nr:hypothetical protein CPC08DRAFT_438585 [Agrocybe pediades]
MSSFEQDDPSLLEKDSVYTFHAHLNALNLLFSYPSMSLVSLLLDPSPRSTPALRFAALVSQLSFHALLETPLVGWLRVQILMLGTASMYATRDCWMEVAQVLLLLFDIQTRTHYWSSFTLTSQYQRFMPSRGIKQHMGCMFRPPYALSPHPYPIYKKNVWCKT